jgi:hypothetical protein
VLRTAYDSVLDSTPAGDIALEKQSLRKKVISKISRIILNGGEMIPRGRVLRRLWGRQRHDESRDALLGQRRREKCSTRALFLAIMIFTFGLFSIAVGILGVCSSTRMEEA